MKVFFTKNEQQKISFWLEQKRQEEFRFHKTEKHWNPSYVIFDILLEELKQ